MITKLEYNILKQADACADHQALFGDMKYRK